MALKTAGYNVVTVAAGSESDPDIAHTVRGPMLTLTPRNKELVAKTLSGTHLLIVSGSYTPVMSWALAHAATIRLKTLFIITTNSSKAVEVGVSGPGVRVLLWKSR